MLFGGAFWVFNSKKLPTHAEDLVEKRKITLKGVLWKKILDARGDYQLFLGQEFKWAETPDLRFYYPASFTIDTFHILPYPELKKNSLPVYIEAGDSLIKRNGVSDILVKHGATSRVFSYHGF